MIEIRKANERGVTNHGWLKSKHTFSFGSYFDPRHQGFSDLLVINDDRVLPSKGFGTHPHDNMEIFTYVLAGQLAHKDSMGNGSVIKPGDVQIMSAGTGITHSEFNPSDTEDVHFLQIWIIPNEKNVSPRYQQVYFSEAEKRGKSCLIISPDGKNGSLTINQDISVFSALLDGHEAIEFNLEQNRYGYIHVARGSLTINGYRLIEGDGAKIRKENRLELINGDEAEILIVDLRPVESAFLK